MSLVHDWCFSQNHKLPFSKLVTQEKDKMSLYSHYQHVRLAGVNTVVKLVLGCI